MNSGWKLNYSKQALKFLEKEKLIRKFKNRIIEFLHGDNIDLKKMGGNWKGYYRLKMGKIRILLTFNFKEKIISVVKAGYRGDIYK